MKSHATTNDARYVPGMEMISDNINMRDRIRTLEARVEFYKRLYLSSAERADALEAALNHERCCYAEAWKSGRRAGRREKEPYLIKIRQVNIR